MAISVYTRTTPDYFSDPSRRAKGSDWGVKLHSSTTKLTFTAAGFTTASLGDIPLILLPPGLVRVHGGLSWIACPIGTATSDLDIGYGAYTKTDGTAVVADYDGIAASLDVGGAAIAEDLNSIAQFFEFDSKTGVTIGCSFDTANSPAAGDLVLTLVYTMTN
jgi:hypothetical protein